MRLDLTGLGGRIVNWMILGKMIKGMDGAMNVLAKIKKIIVVMDHCVKDGSPTIIPACTLSMMGAAWSTAIDWMRGACRPIQTAIGEG